jgi:class 3 adenylate cyclase
MSDAISQWLERLGVAQYAEAFEQNAIGLEHLADLDHGILKEIGVCAVGHRMTILKAAAALTGSDSSAAPRLSAESAPSHGKDFPGEAEHRQLSVMFCDLVGSTALSQRLDLETYRELLRAYQVAARKAIECYDGYIARYMGDGLLAYFGYPSAHEDDPERAVRAGLEVVQTVSAVSTSSDIVLRVRVGIATGRVVAGDIVGEGASEERAVLGETPNLTARLQSLAAPNSVVIAQATKRLVEGRFDLDALKPQRLKGLSEPVRAYQARAIRPSSRFEAATISGLAAFVGRRGELQLLTSRWGQVKKGAGQVVLLGGEAGIGKSRVLRELRECIGDESYTLLRYQCTPYGTKTAFLPIIEQFQHGAGFAQGDTAAQKLDKLEHLLTDAVEDLSVAAPLIASLLSLPADRYPSISKTPQRQKLEMIAVLVGQIETYARVQPVLVSLEDVHWIDPSTLEVFDAVVERIQKLPVLVVITHRPEFESPWGRWEHVSQRTLNRLDRAEGAALSTQVTGGRTLPEAVLQQILEHTDGVPLFIEELTKTVLEAGLLSEADGRYSLDGPLPPMAIPATLQDSLMARLDRLARAKGVAQAAACIGREFSAALLEKVLKRLSLAEDLRELLDAGLIFRRDVARGRVYIFKHALVQDTAYDSLLLSRRRQLHARIAEALEASVDPEPGVLARHFSKAGLAEKASTYFLAAGRRALTVSALAEAGSELEIGLREIDALPPSLVRDRIELDLRTALGAARIALYGWSYPSVALAYEPAFALAEKLDDEQALSRILWGLCVHFWTRAEFAQAHHWLGKLAEAADRCADSELSVVRDMSSGCQCFWEAKYKRAYRYTAHEREIYDERRHASIAAYTNHDPLCFSLHWAGSLLLWIVGYPDLALEHADEAHALARRIEHPFNSAFALTAGSEGLLMRGDTERMLMHCDEAQQIVDEEALGDFAQHVLVNNWRGRTYTRMGDFATGYRLTNLATTHWREAEGRICNALFWGGEAIALGGLGRTREALTLIDAAIGHCRDTGDRYMEPEVLRVRAELTLAADEYAVDAVRTILFEALRIARDHGAKSWELRAATSLAKLWRERDERARARDLLAPIYAWFTEGFDTADLREAGALLEELS